ncbi:salicylate synthase [Anopheles sinensis]|uniref:Salicylate synthase n=1 Tax=Anopheles sinensis TaxID=74873 RepID=A0A084W617_ANOSI|nr:salicylate synthase [Anopheles sinensis]
MLAFKVLLVWLGPERACVEGNGVERERDPIVVVSFCTTCAMMMVGKRALFIDYPSTYRGATRRSHPPSILEGLSHPVAHSRPSSFYAHLRDDNIPKEVHETRWRTGDVVLFQPVAAETGADETEGSLPPQPR